MTSSEVSFKTAPLGLCAIASTRAIREKRKEVAIFCYLEIGPLKELEFTGIAHVTAAIAAEMLGDTQNVPLFFFGRMMVDNEVVESLLQARSGDLLEWHIKRCSGRSAPLSAGGAGHHVGIFPNTKTCRSVFDFETQIIHDLSTLLTPQYHNQDTIDYHAKTILDDLRTNDLTICVSEATRTDILRYLGPIDPNRLVTIHNAASAIDVTLSVSQNSKPHILILGTIEPRKNVGEVLSLLRRHPSFADQYNFIFLGRYGWGASVDRLVEQYGLSAMVADGSLLFPGFVSEATKNELVQSATLLIYPSLFEGFGLPIVEAMSLGVPCLTTVSSSMPEVGGEACFYFDPFTPNGFRTAFVAALIDIRQNGAKVSERCRQQAARFSWKQSYRDLVEAVVARLPPTMTLQ